VTEALYSVIVGLGLALVGLVGFAMWLMCELAAARRVIARQRRKLHAQSCSLVRSAQASQALRARLAVLQHELHERQATPQEPVDA
jgi:hypothetical protein